MIDFRYHVVSIVAVFLALALGLFLGSTTLQGTVANSLNRQADKVRSENRTLEQRLSTTQGQATDGQRFDAALEPYAVAGRLAGQTVAVVSAPGVVDKDRRSLETTLTTAGATLTADVRLSSSYLDPTQSAELGQLAKELALPGRALPAGTGAEQADSVLADVLSARAGRATTAAAHLQATVTAFADGKLVQVAGQPPTRPAALAVVMLPAADDSLTPAVAAAQDTVVFTLARDLDAAGEGTVLAGPPPAAAGATPGPLEAAGRQPDRGSLAGVSTVASDDQPSGRIATVFALVAQRLGTAGAFGPGRPTPLPTASSGASS